MMAKKLLSGWRLNGSPHHIDDRKPRPAIPTTATVNPVFRYLPSEQIKKQNISEAEESTSNQVIFSQKCL